MTQIWKVTYTKAGETNSIEVLANDDIEAGKAARAQLGVKRMPDGTLYTPTGRQEPSTQRPGIKHITSRPTRYNNGHLETDDIRIIGARHAASTHLGIIPAGVEARQTFQGPMVPGPWAFAVQHCTVIDNYGGSAAERQRMQLELSIGEPFTVDGLPGIWMLLDRNVRKFEGEGVKPVPYDSEHPDAKAITA